MVGRFPWVWLAVGIACSPPTKDSASPGTSSGGDDAGATDVQDRLRLGTFNIEWLTADPLDGDMRRNDVDHQMIVSLIDEMDVDIMVLEEIEGEAALAHLPFASTWSMAVGETGWSQNIAMVWRNDRVSVSNIRELNLPSTSGASKEPFAARVSMGDLSFTLLGIHHAAFTDAESSQERNLQAIELVDWVTARLPDEESGDFGDNVVVAGDFNDTFDGLNSTWRSLDVFLDGGFTFVSTATDGYTNIDFQSLIDHVALRGPIAERWSPSEQGCTIMAHDEISPWSDYTGGYRDTQNISDHRPLWTDIPVVR